MPIDAPIETLKQSVGLGGSAGAVFFFLRLVAKSVMQRLDRRQARLDAEHDALDMGWREYRLFLERERMILVQRVSGVERQSRAAFTAFQHVAAALIRHDPQDPALLEAERLMAAAFPIDFSMAAAMASAALDKDGGG